MLSDPFHDLVGASAESSSSSVERLLTVRFTDPAGLVAKEGGATGAAAFLLAPQAITDKVYADARKTIEESMREKGIAAEVRVVTAGSFLDKSSRSDLFTGVVLGASGLGLMTLIVRLLFRKA